MGGNVVTTNSTPGSAFVDPQTHDRTMADVPEVSDHRGRRLLAFATAVTAAAALALSALPAATAQAGSVARQAAGRAVDDVSAGNQVGVAVSVDVLANDDPSLVADSVRPVRPSDGTRVADFAIDGEGWWLAVSNGAGASTMIEFLPEPGFIGDPTPQQYSVLDADGVEYFATVTITYESVSQTTTTTAPATTPAPPSGDLPATGQTTVVVIAPALLLVVAGLLLVRRSASGSNSRSRPEAGSAHSH
jgi:hypothetical protein